MDDLYPEDSASQVLKKIYTFKQYSQTSNKKSIIGKVEVKEKN